MILYEYPLNERIRTLLRLEELFQHFTFFIAQNQPLNHHTALIKLFEIADIAGRSDLKTDLIKELDRQRQGLETYRGNPNIQIDTLENLIEKIKRTLLDLNKIIGKLGHHLNDNEWLSSIRYRSVIPGGTCCFDLPAYYAWRHHPAEERREDIEKWIAPLLPLNDAITIILGLTRETGHISKVIAENGSYQKTLTGRVLYQLIQVQVTATLNVIPEASANKYMLWVRFTDQDGDMRPRRITSNVPFLLTLCSL
ncbi:cell division protein ZapD [Candidatus Pandoraea novymonadis]|uniref:Cell division protein ZapD n=1 Tax=Candidatus Pandoraea novymonadis TaxID=1808959 RepID=A0ABX5FFC9_9BURK|nr:cell division protein ZapD [Candidatus Pandoraea novymonadis]PSB92423.1 Cell division protein ZapD [Candidatus Pandoraea novymonadis]